MRIEKYFDFILIDEIQDLGGHDFNFITKLLECNVNFLYVGDFYQHTYDTSIDGNVNKTLYNDYNKYKAKWKNINIDEDTLKYSYRCTDTVCSFVKENLGINICSYAKQKSVIQELENNEHISAIMNNRNIVKLFLESSTKYNGNTENWGNSKGQTYEDVCVVLNPKTYELYKTGKLIESNSSTKNKLYVACTRTKNNLYFVEEKRIKGNLIKKNM